MVDISGGGFAGGLASGFGDTFASQQKIDLARRAQEQQQQIQLSGQVNDALNNLYSTAAAIAKSAADAGQPVPASSIKALADQAAELSQNAAKRGILSPDIAAIAGTRIQALSGLMGAGPKPIVTSEDLVGGTKTFGRVSGGSIVNMPVVNGPSGGEPARPGQTNLTGPNTTSTVVSTQDIPPGAPAVASSVPTPTIAQQTPSFADRFDAANATAPDSGTFKLSMEMPSVNKLPPELQPGGAAVDYAINNNVTGNEFLKALPPTARNKVVDVANYKIPLNTETVRKGARGLLASWVHQYTGGEYDAKWFQPMQKVINDFNAGTSNASPAQAMVVGNTAIQHLGTMAQAVDAMAQVPGLLDKISQSNEPFVSYAAKALQNKAVRGTSEGMALQSFMTARNRYVDEIVKFYGGAQGGTEEDRKRSIDVLDAAVGLPSLYSAMNTEMHLLDSKVSALQDRWKTGQLGPRFADTALRVLVPDFPVIQQKSKEAEDMIAKKYLSIRFANGQTSTGSAPIAAPRAGQVIIQNGFRYDAVTHQPLGPAQ